MSSPLTPDQLQMLLDGPALAPPPGETTNLVDPPNEKTLMVAVIATSVILSTIAICLRMYTKARIICRLVPADYAIVMGWVIFVSYFIPVGLATKVCPGIHQWNIQLKTLRKDLYYIHVGSIMYGCCIFFIKLSILLQYIQIFVPARKGSALYWISYALIWINLIFYLVSSFLEIFACRPLAKVWDPLINSGHCLNLLVLNVASSTINSVSDIAILILPQISIWRLQMSWKKKIQISAIFLIGVFACICSIMRTIYTIELLISPSDVAFSTWRFGIWTIPEMASGIIVACLPVSPKFFQALGKTRAISRVKSALRSLLEVSIFTRRRSTGSYSVGRETNPHGSTRQANPWPERYDTLPDEELAKLPASNSMAADSTRYFVKNKMAIETCD